MSKKNILILGADGMVGRMVYLYFLQINKYKIHATSRKNKKFLFFDASNPKELKKLLKYTNYVINCIGINNVSEKNIKEAYKVNSFFPKKLDKLSKEMGFKLIHISSDAVFDSLDKKVSEKNVPDTKDLYGLSKLKGETVSKNSLTIRTSLLGFSPNKKTGLLEWFLSSKTSIDGYQNQIWSGCTNLQLAKFCEKIIYKNMFEKLRKKSNILHFCPIGPVSKFRILYCLKKITNKKTLLIKIYSKKTITRYLASEYFDNKFFKAYTTNLNLALKELIKFENKIKYE